MLDKSAASLLSQLDEAISSGFFFAAEHQLVFRSDFLLAGLIESIPAPARGALRREAMGHSGRRAEPEDRQFWMTGHPLWTADRPAGPFEGAAAGSGELRSKSHGLIMDGRTTAGIRTAERVWRLHFRLALAGKLANLREFDTAESLIGEAEAGLRERGTRVWDAAPAAVRARLFLQAGRFGEARRQAELAIAAAGRDAVPVLRPLACSVLSTIYLYEGDLPGDRVPEAGAGGVRDGPGGALLAAVRLE
ncbi:hypothetical protein ACFRJ1_09850 [Streptomyces sp. NPDC056773]|uniref:hypothetical protein n=1 Tax=unclassified Streptomyces TaxID=2593676 RepID=UPI0036BD5D46